MGKREALSSCLVKSINGSKHELIEWGLTGDEADIIFEELMSAEAKWAEGAKRDE